MRQELLSAALQIQTMERQITNYKAVSTKAYDHSTKDEGKASDINNRILALKAKHEEGKEQFELDIKKLQEQLKEKDKRIEYNEKSLNPAMKDNKAAGPNDEFANPIEILKIRVKNQTEKNREKKRLLEQYVRNARIIQEAFETISEATGIVSIQEIVTTFIKAEEQNVALFNYVNQLSQESDNIEEHTKYLDYKIDQFTSMMKMTDNDFDNKIRENDERSDNLRESI
jgi:hypothetical protein